MLARAVMKSYTILKLDKSLEQDLKMPKKYINIVLQLLISKIKVSIWLKY